MKKISLFLLFAISTSSYQAQVNPSLVNIPHEVFVNDGKSDFNKILSQDASIEEKVKTLHSFNELSHDLTIQTNSFNEYWKKYKSQWFYISFNKQQKPLLLFKGLKNDVDEREYVEIFDLEKDRNYRGLFSDVGVLLAYKIHPLTSEVILYVHKYPCCKSASHNIYRLRRVEEGLKINDRFFVGRDSGDMVGPFFPKKVEFSDKYYKLGKKTEVRWSPEVVEENAFKDWAETNLIIHYNEGALYKILYEKNDWQFVVFFNGIAEEQSRVLNYTNFKNKGVYGWIKVKNTN
ncbi:hypothetical protein ERX46_17115 [Brumimicrobium glaciale]|uniref:Uncharacterized protein n=1 Tax=Brumimicrobium glaciale TaxID=200475 RepID=A0A4Q4KCR9_9FLAO|nr:hypothetical protein [Brumimicrobium glaciale]RYM30801.1 hypothetical protein ERX46_17115 [Brumimicrobium glaciale]